MWSAKVNPPDQSMSDLTKFALAMYSPEVGRDE